MPPPPPLPASVDIIDINSRLDQRPLTHYLLSALHGGYILIELISTDTVFVVVVFHCPSQICSNFCFQVAARVLPM